MTYNNKLYSYISKYIQNDLKRIFNNGKLQFFVMHQKKNTAYFDVRDRSYNRIYS